MSSPTEEAYAMYFSSTKQIENLRKLRGVALAAAHNNGESYADIAKRTGLSRARVAQLVKS